MKIEIDTNSGFCHGVTTAIKKAEKELSESDRLYCLGDIVHNESEVERLRALGLTTIDHATFGALGSGARVLLRAHGEPPATYRTAAGHGITLVDATCPVVLQLQRRIAALCPADGEPPQIVIYGKRGHAEVVGLVGQTGGRAIVIQGEDEAAALDFGRDIYLFSQTTMPLDGFHAVIRYITAHIAPGAELHSFDTICRQVANRLPNIRTFAGRHDVVLFVCGQKSSNGRMLYDACRQVNPRTHLVDTPQAIRPEWFEGAESVGICGATSTPKWLMEACRDEIGRM